MTELGKLTRKLESTLGRLLGTQGGEVSEPLELLAHVLHDVERRVEPAGGGRRRFPFTQLTAIVLAVRKEDEDRCAAVLEGLDARIRERLRELACEPPRRLDVTVHFVRKPRKPWTDGQRVELQYARDADASDRAVPAGRPALSGRGTAAEHRAQGNRAQERGTARGDDHREGGAAGALTVGHARAIGPRPAATSAAAAALPTTRLVVLRGTAGKRTYTLQQRVIRFGRGEDHAEMSGRTRHNDVAFADDGDEVNRTVARAQAHLRHDAARGECRLFDDGSSNGTRIVRESDVIPVTAQGPRGVRVASGDVIELGHARLRVEIDPTS